MLRNLYYTFTLSEQKEYLMTQFKKHRKSIFTIMTISIPVLFFVFLELFLCAFDLFSQQSLFYEEGKRVTINPNVGERYFNKKLMPVPNLYPQTFELEKGKNTFRVFCLGGSTTAGFPYEMTVPFPGQLKMMLEEDYPDKKIEVINLGLSAVNSFTVLDWVPDVLKYNPDLIILYMGHNEFYGAYGTGSTVSISNNAGFVRFVLNLRKLHTTQMIISFLDLFMSNSGDASSATVMEKVVAKNFIAADSELREITYKNYRENLELILQECAEVDVPVMLSNLVSNLKDQPPLDRDNSNDSDSSSSLYSYNLGIKLLASRDTTAAFGKFLEAKDRDAVPFRAHSELNKIISETAQQKNIHFVDMEKAFRYFSPETIPGSRIFCDHLHPNPVGYRIMANEFRNAISKTGLLSTDYGDRKYSIIPEKVTGLDWEIGAVKLYKLTRSWPFGNQRVDYKNYTPFVNEKTASVAMDYIFNHHVWGKAHEEMADFYKTNNEFEKACLEYEAIVEMYPDKHKFYTNLIECGKKINAWKLVKQTCEKGIKQFVLNGSFYYDLAMANRVMGDMDTAIKNLKLAAESQGATKDQQARYYFTYVSFMLDASNNENAKSAYKDFIALFPDYPPAQTLKERIERLD